MGVPISGHSEGRISVLDLSVEDFLPGGFDKIVASTGVETVDDGFRQIEKLAVELIGIARGERPNGQRRDGRGRIVLDTDLAQIKTVQVLKRAAESEGVEAIED